MILCCLCCQGKVSTSLLLSVDHQFDGGGLNPGDLLGLIKSAPGPVR